jgi:Na+/melibiose symporter-like transporter
MLALRGVHPNVESAEAALLSVQATPMPERPAKRHSLRTWVHSVYLLLVFGGFMSPSAAAPPEQSWLDRLRSVASLLLGVALWLMTWVFPVTFMVLMAWGCETHARQLGRRALVFYDGEAASVSAAIALAERRRDRGHDKRAILRGAALFLSLAIPLAFIAYVDHVRKTVGFNWLGAVGALVAISIVIAVGVVASRRDM